MLAERVGTVVLISSPQNSKNEKLPDTNLLTVPSFRKVVGIFDDSINVGFAGSLNPELQMASVVMSVASHKAFVDSLRDEIYPGSVYSDSIDFRFVGHSIGEVGSAVLSGALDCHAAGEMLDIRQKITDQPLNSALRFMVAVAGAEISRLEEILPRVIENFEGRIRGVIGNKNTPSQAVLSLELQTDSDPEEARKPKNMKPLINQLTGLLADARNPKFSMEDFRLTLLRIKGCFHSPFLEAEEGVFIQEVGPKVEALLRSPKPDSIYSPMKPGWIGNRQELLNILLHPLTPPVDFIQAMTDIAQIPSLVAIVTADVKDITPVMVYDNIRSLRDDIEIFNIKDQASLRSVTRSVSSLLQDYVKIS